MPETNLTTGVFELRPSEFEMIRDLAMRSFGLDLRAGKERLVATRLARHLRTGGFQSFRQYYDRVRADSSGELLVGLIDALTTNHTAFLREPVHFDFLRELLGSDFKGRRRIDIWTTASATGEEPYTLLFTALSAFESTLPPDVQILASDISTRALSIAKRGSYTRERLAALPGAWISRFFQADAGNLQVKADLRSRITFQRINLIETLPVNMTFPVIFCRNVMIYFNKATQEDLVNRLANKLEPGGYLFVGHSESLSGINHPLGYVRPAVYQKAR
ncbi:MAG TPA: protein-glutamate O-methyltransferase CheR [Bryobacteraceae bacterium]|nr:protein-glutamate O-methyltransferase CheR [Bryobacteraceae bacterium]